MGGENFVKNACKVLPFDKLYTISSKRVHPQCKDPSELHIQGLFDWDKLLASAEKIDKTFYDEATSAGTNEEVAAGEPEEEMEEHVKIAEEVMKKMHIKFYKENFYVYENGVYHKNKTLIEQAILSIKRNAKKYLRAEALDYIRINQIVQEMTVSEQFINFKNGLYDLINRRLIAHSPLYFTTCQINANYINDHEYLVNKDIEEFLNDVTCNNPERKRALLQIIGYCMTASTKWELAFFFYRSIC